MEVNILMKRLAMILSMAVALLMTTACTSDDKSDEKETEQSITAESSAVEIEVTEEAPEETTFFEEETTAAVEETTVKAEADDFVPVEGLSEKYGDLENRSFSYKGKIFKLGESTLQDLIDGGIPFKESELNNIGNNVNKNYETGTYNVKINDNVSMQFQFINITDSNITESEALLSYVRWYALYVPQSDYDESRNAEFSENISSAAKDVCFSFPLTLTKEQLLENNNNATEFNDNFNSVEYKIDSEVYMGDSGYSFEFNKDTDQLKEISISWLP